ncbi:probable cinnamyl alcohol dehydrogenase 6 [Olea europaea var. sylvestris]|uniref:probable cinnamyl alcohol dehydrogenase 6 n=1 Tax=Olea europaea var. sylvestris TaxID=158386 RepID=UPI000C1D3FAE|nr:probable cinnamyl alcohol dehydrogenase 6 [Olea europaea var. sylvestris]
MAQTTPNHTLTVSGWGAHDPSGNITPYTFKRRENGVNDVTIEILYCGICHTDLHQVRNDWGSTMYPIVPGHEITGIITKVGSNVSNFKVGYRAGVGCLAASCLNCDYCKDGQENYCDQLQFTYNGIFWDGSITYGGYSKFLVADHRYHIKSNITCTKMYAKMMWDFINLTGKRAVKGSIIGGIKEMQEMLDVCGKHNITCEIEVVTPNQINEAFERLAKNDVKYRFVIDIAGKSSNL